MSVAMAFALQKLPRRALALFGVALLLCLSRIHVGTHYLTDVVGGAATGIAAAIVVRSLYRENTRLDRFVTAIL